MSLIEGIGDELTITITVFVLIVTLVSAWVSTRVTESRLTLTHTQLGGLRIELNELTTDEQSEEEAGSSTESTEFEHLSDDLASEPPVGESETGAHEIKPTSVADVGASNLQEPQDQSAKRDADVSTGNGEDESKLQATASSPAHSSAVDNKDSKDTSASASNQTGRIGDSENTTNQSQRTNVDETDTSTSPRGDVSLKIKFLNETERIVQTRLEETVGNFKRLNFAEESRGGRVVHLIFNGQFLRDDSRQLGSYSLVDNCVLHCHISQRQQSPGTAQEQPDQGDIDLGQFMVPLFACTIGFVWYLRWQYSYMFNTMSTMSLSAVTVLFMLAVLAAWRG